MKRFSVSMLRTVNRQASQSGLKFQYLGRTDNPAKTIEDYLSHPDWYLGIKIKDSQTKKVIYEDRKYKDLSEVPDKTTAGR